RGKTARSQRGLPGLIISKLAPQKSRCALDFVVRDSFTRRKGSRHRSHDQLPQKQGLLHIFVMSIFFISAGRVARFGKGPLQIRLVDPLAECEREQMPASTGDANGIAACDRVISKNAAGDASNATSCDQ